MTRLSTGIADLDEILPGGPLAGRVDTFSLPPGTGKPTPGLQFLEAGARQGESDLFVTLSQSEAELRANAEIQGWNFGQVRFLDVHPDSDGIGLDQQSSIFHSAEVVLIPVARQSQDALRQLQPMRVVFDNLSQPLLLSHHPCRDRRHKYCGGGDREGLHINDFGQGGLRVLPLLLALDHGQKFEPAVMTSGAPGPEPTQSGFSSLNDLIEANFTYKHKCDSLKELGTINKRINDHKNLLRSSQVPSRKFWVGKPLPNIRGIFRGAAFPSDPVLQSEDVADA